MSHPPAHEQSAKALRKQLKTAFNQSRDALAQSNFPALANHARALQVVAQAANHTLIVAQARLLEQAAERGQLQQATKALVKLKEAILSLPLTDDSLNSAPLPKIQPPKVTAPPQATARVFTPRPGDESFTKRLGNYLVDAELVTPAQIEVALADQRATGSRLGDILVARGWLKSGTIEFIMEKVVIPERTTHPKPTLSTAAPAKLPQPKNEMNLERETLIDQKSSTFLDMDGFRPR